MDTQTNEDFAFDLLAGAVPPSTGDIISRYKLQGHYDLTTACTTALNVKLQPLPYSCQLAINLCFSGLLSMQRSYER